MSDVPPTGEYLPSMRPPVPTQQQQQPPPHQVQWLPQYQQPQPYYLQPRQYPPSQGLPPDYYLPLPPPNYMQQPPNQYMQYQVPPLHWLPQPSMQPGSYMQYVQPHPPVHPYYPTVPPAQPYQQWGPHEPMIQYPTVHPMIQAFQQLGHHPPGYAPAGGPSGSAPAGGPRRVNIPYVIEQMRLAACKHGVNFATLKMLVLYDVENERATEKEVKPLLAAIRKAFHGIQIEARSVAVTNRHCTPALKTACLLLGQGKDPLIEITAGNRSKELADERLVQELFSWMFENKPPAIIMNISADSDFSAAFLKAFGDDHDNEQVYKRLTSAINGAKPATHKELKKIKLYGDVLPHIEDPAVTYVQTSKNKLRLLKNKVNAELYSYACLHSDSPEDNTIAFATDNTVFVDTISWLAGRIIQKM